MEAVISNLSFAPFNSAGALSKATKATGFPIALVSSLLAGVHSGDSACVIPPISIAQKHIKTINDYTRKIAIELNVVGLMNIQYAITGGGRS